VVGDLRVRVVGPDLSPDVAAVDPAEAMDVNRRYFVAYVTSLESAAGLRVLDFGCGGGSLVRMLRAAGVDGYGADTFYAGASYKGEVFERLRAAEVLREIDGSGRLPFPDGYFDVVVSDQVFEHVEALGPVLDELDRVLAPGGHSYHHFPSLEVLREGHIHIPLSHRFKPGRFRTAYTTALRAAGLGDHKEGRTIRAWVDWRLGWIDEFCHYRPYRELRREFDRRYRVEHLEIDYCRFRAAGNPVLEAVLGAAPLRVPAERTFRRLAFMCLRLTPLAAARGT
jgi:SAM-dependent methyltransferase